MVRLKLSVHIRTEKKTQDGKIFAIICQVRLLNCTMFLHDILVMRTRFVSWQRFQNQQTVCQSQWQNEEPEWSISSCLINLMTYSGLCSACDRVYLPVHGHEIEYRYKRNLKAVFCKPLQSSAPNQNEQVLKIQKPCFRNEHSRQAALADYMLFQRNSSFKTLMNIIHYLHEITKISYNRISVPLTTSSGCKLPFSQSQIFPPYFLCSKTNYSFAKSLCS